MNFLVVNSIWDGLARSTTSDGIYKTHEGNAVGACDDVDIWEMTHLLDFCNWPCDNMNYSAGRTVRVLDLVVCSFSECGSTYTAQLHMHIITVQCYICSAHFTG